MATSFELGLLPLQPTSTNRSSYHLSPLISPLAGGYYANIFTHYRPIGDPQWYQKENPENTPEPLIDVGKCELVGKPTDYSKGAVKCENPAIGPHLSPKMVTLTSGDDLYNHWLSVGPSFDDEVGTEEL